MNNIILNDELEVENMIYEIRGRQVMLDSDLAKLYGVETKRINEAVKNNPYKFPERFSWIITKDEVDIISRSKFSTLNNEKSKRGQNIKYLPRVFTEQGVAMLATILKSKTATEISIRIMDAFVLMRHLIVDNKDVYKSLNNVNNKLVEHDEKLNYLFSKFDKKEQLFLPGKTYDAYSEVMNILNESKNEIIIIDSYADNTILDFIKNINSKIIVITSKKSKLTNTEIISFNKQYNKLKIIYNNSFHDRYFIIDRKNVFHVGTSLNHVGEKLFSINKLDDKVIKEHLINYVLEVINNNHLHV